MNHREEFLRKRQEDRRLVILRFLQEEPDYRLSVSLLQDALDVCGNRASRDQIVADGEWLQEVGLVHLEELGTIPMLRLTERGADVALGRLTVAGVKRPSPKG